MSSTASARPELPEVALAQWADTKTTLHLWLQIVGKIRMASMAPRNHWWHVPLYVDVRGLTTRRMRAKEAVAFEISFDFVDHRLVVATNRGEIDSFDLADGLSVAEFDARLHTLLAARGLDVAIREEPYGMAFTTPFPDDREHASYEREAIEQYWRILEWTNEVLEEFAGWYCGKTSPVHLFWHGMDLAVTRFGGARAPARPEFGRVDRETYTHEVVSFGFWMGDENVREPSYYSYTFPEPAELRLEPLQPSAASWSQQAGGSLALLPYDAVRVATDPRNTLLAFLETAYRAGAGLAGWDQAALTSSWCPSPPRLNAIVAGRES